MGNMPTIFSFGSAEVANQMIQASAKRGSLKTNDISDGYHSFGELYQHRIALFIVLAKALAYGSLSSGPTSAAYVWKSKAHSDGSVWDGWFILGIHKEAGKQITYHLPISEWDNCLFAEELDRAPTWDGHSPQDVLERLSQY